MFLVLLAGHLLGDWVTQSDWQAANKTRSWAALAAHVSRYHLVRAREPVLGRQQPTAAGR